MVLENDTDEDDNTDDMDKGIRRTMVIVVGMTLLVVLLLLLLVRSLVLLVSELVAPVILAVTLLPVDINLIGSLLRYTLLLLELLPFVSVRFCFFPTVRSEPVLRPLLLLDVDFGANDG